MICLLESITFEGLGNLWITLTICLARHSQIHTHFGTFSSKVCLQSFPDLFRTTFCYANLVLCHIGVTLVLFDFLELAGWHATLRALNWRLLSLVNVTTYGTNKFLFHRFAIGFTN